METEIIGITAFSPWSQLALAKTMSLSLPLLSDFPNLTTIKTYGVEQQVGSVMTAKRSYFVVDKHEDRAVQADHAPLQPGGSFPAQPSPGPPARNDQQGKLTKTGPEGSGDSSP